MLVKANMEELSGIEPESKRNAPVTSSGASTVHFRFVFPSELLPVIIDKFLKLQL